MKNRSIILSFVLIFLSFSAMAFASPDSFTGGSQLDYRDVSTVQRDVNIAPYNYRGYQSPIYEVGSTAAPSDYNSLSGSSEGEHRERGGVRTLGGGTDPGEQSHDSPIGDAWVLIAFAACFALWQLTRRKRALN